MPEDYHRTEANQSASDPRTQEDRILFLLQEAWPNWVSALDLAKISLQYSARIHALRHKRGILISNRIEHQPDGAKHGFFRLGPPPTPRSSVIRKQRGRDSALQGVTIGAPKTPRFSEDGNGLLFDLTLQHKDLG